MIVGRHLRRRRLGHRVDEQPAAVRAAPAAGCGWPRRAAVMLGCGLVALVVARRRSGSAWAWSPQARDIAIPSSDVEQGALAPRCARSRWPLAAGLGGFALTMLLPAHRRHPRAAVRLRRRRRGRAQPAAARGSRPLVGRQQRLRLAGRRRTAYYDPTISCTPGRAVQPDARDDPSPVGHASSASCCWSASSCRSSGSAAATSDGASAYAAGACRSGSARRASRRTVAGVTISTWPDLRAAD